MTLAEALNVCDKSEYVIADDKTQTLIPVTCKGTLKDYCNAVKDAEKLAEEGRIVKAIKVVNGELMLIVGD